MSTQNIPFFRGILFRLSGINPLDLGFAIPTNKYLFKCLFTKTRQHHLWRSTLSRTRPYQQTFGGLHHLDGKIITRGSIVREYKLDYGRDQERDIIPNHRKEALYLHFEDLLRKHMKNQSFPETEIKEYIDGIREARSKLKKDT